MEQLEKDWLTKGLMDYEYKKYILLAYLKKVRENFDDLRLYPFLSDVAFHYRNLQLLKSHKTMISESFPKEITKAEFNKLKLHYKNLVEDDELMDLIEEILSFATPRMKKVIETGKNIYEDVEGKLTIESIGISPLYNKEGYVFISPSKTKETNVYEYRVSVFENANEKFRGIHMEFIEQIRKGIGKTFEQMKLELIRKRKSLPNPATYLINAEMSCPYEETLIPIAKRLLVRHVSKDAA